MAMVGIFEDFWVVIGLICVWALLFAASTPIRQAYLNGMIPSRQRATILSFDSLMSSTGGVWTQPLLGRAADVWGYAPTYLMGSAISALAIPFIALSRRQHSPADLMTEKGDGTARGNTAAPLAVWTKVHILFTTTRGAGHVGPLVPFARACVRPAMTSSWPARGERDGSSGGQDCTSCPSASRPSTSARRPGRRCSLASGAGRAARHPRAVHRPRRAGRAPRDARGGRGRGSRT